jgi:uncharacterized protein
MLSVASLQNAVVHVHTLTGEKNMSQAKTSQPKRINVGVWFEIPALDIARATKFYEALFATTLKQEAMGPMQMAVFPYDQANATSGCVMKAPGLAPSSDGAIIYLNADPSLDTILNRVKSTGGKISLGRTELPPGMGCYAHIVDTEGNRVGIHALG